MTSDTGLPKDAFINTVFGNVTGAPGGPTRPKLHFFDMNQIPEEVAGAAENNVPGELVMFQGITGDEEQDGLSLASYYVGPGLTAPRHRHDSDQIILVLEGELIVGKRRIGPLGGYYTQAGQPYSFTGGPRGCRFLEFRPHTWFWTIPAVTEEERANTFNPRTADGEVDYLAGKLKEPAEA